MNPHRSLDIWRINETKARTARFIKLIRQETDPVLPLHFQVFSMCLRDVGRCEAREIVSVEKNWHWRCSTRSPREVCTQQVDFREAT